MWVTFGVVVLTAILALVSLLRAAPGLDRLARELRDELRVGRDEARAASRELREEVLNCLRSLQQTLLQLSETASQVQRSQLEQMTDQIRRLTQSNQEALERIRATFDGRAKELQESNEKRLAEMRREVGEGLTKAAEALSQGFAEIGRNQQAQLEATSRQLKELTASNQEALERIRATFDGRVKELQDSNEKKLEEMRRTVDEKLHETLERRLSESFRLVSERLEAVHQGLGEMQNLASDVGDLKRVLSNVKARGTFGEIQLGAILEEILVNGQFERNVRVNPSSQERVDYAIRLPGSKEDLEQPVWLPIDAKFPQEDYQRLLEAVEQGDPEGARMAAESLERAVRVAARDVHDKYVVPPYTTDFAIIFLPSEGLYAEVLRRPGLVDELRQRYRVVLAGPNNMAGILSALRMGFQTLAIERRATEVWKVLGAVKTEFGKFGEALGKVRRHLESASKSLDETDRRTRAMQQKLRGVEALPGTEVTGPVALPPPEESIEA